MSRAKPCHRASWLVCGAALAALGALLVGCALPTDARPRTIADSAVADLNPSTTDVPATTAEPGAPTIRLYLFRNNTLVGIDRRTNDGRDANTVLAQLLTSPNEDERASGYTTYIPPQTRLLRLQLATDGTITIDLSKEIDSVGGSTSKAAYAQLVFTATALPGVSNVQFRTEGKPVSVPTDDGNIPRASRRNYHTPFLVAGAATNATSSTVAPDPQLPLATTLP